MSYIDMTFIFLDHLRHPREELFKEKKNGKGGRQYPTHS